MIPCQIVGQPGSGKTTLIVDIITEMIRAGVTVGSIKHTAHAYELDKPGKDSFRHRQAGAAPAAMMTRDMAAVYLPRTADMTPETLLEKFYAHLDVVLIEGWISGPFNKIEIWRKALEKPLLFPDVPGIKAIVSDDPLPHDTNKRATENHVSCFRRNAVSDIAAFIIGRLSGLTPDAGASI